MRHRIRILGGVLLATVITALASCTTTDAERLAGFPLSEGPLTGKFVWHDLITDDVAVAQRFYGGLFGWEFEATSGPNGGDYTLIRMDGRAVAGMVQLDDPAGIEYSRWLGYLSVADVDQAVKFTRARGGEAAVGPLELGNIGRAAAIIDPQGAVVGLIRSRHGDPDDTIRRGIGEIVWNEMVASDDLEAVDFYQRLAGLQKQDDVRAGGTYRMMHSQGRKRAGIMQRPADDVNPFWLTHFGVDDVRVAAAQAAELGGTVLLAPSDEVRNGLLALVTDPSGAILALHEWTQ